MVINIKLKLANWRAFRRGKGCWVGFDTIVYCGFYAADFVACTGSHGICNWLRDHAFFQAIDGGV